MDLVVAPSLVAALLLWAASSVHVATASNLHYSPRSAGHPRTLTFPITAPTRIQFIGGIGIPVEDLVYESVTSGYVLKAEYFLPTKAEEFRPNYLKPQTIHRRSLNVTQSADDDNNGLRRNQTLAGVGHKHRPNGGHRWTIYRSIEMVLDRARQPGRVCLLRSICEHAALPLSYESGMWAEILHIILTPSASCDELERAAQGDYLRAEEMGRKGEDCAAAFSECSSSPIDRISTILSTSD